MSDRAETSRPFNSPFFSVGLGVWGLLLLPTLVAAETVPVKRIGFNAQVRAILSENCFHCHGPDENTREAGLRLDQRQAAIEFGAVDPDDADASTLLERILEHDDDLVMPPPSSKKGRLSDQQVAILRQWIEEGAEYEPHWAFAPLADVQPPDLGMTAASPNADWPLNPIDPFVLATLQAADVAPSPPADRSTLLRRVTLDLTGLLPSPQQIEQFLGDHRPDAYERVVDSLLASPAFAERWGRHWLDQARYADSHGYSIDSQRAMWPYRDWVIRAIADDMPFDQFTLEQLAGDLLPDATRQQKIASAFHRNTLINQEGGVDNDQFRHESVVDRVNTTGAVWLGLTVACAQCHTHKYDPIDHREYYELSAFFNSGSDVNNTGATIPVLPGEVLGTPASPNDLQLAKLQQRLEQQLLTSLQQAQDTVSATEAAAQPNAGKTAENPADPSVDKELLAALQRPAGQRNAAARKRVLDALRSQFPHESDRLRDPAAVSLMVMAELPQRRQTFVSLRGDFLRPDREVGPLSPGGLAAVTPPLPAAESRSRIDLAQWLTSDQNPLTPRVTVNRIWMHYFGLGLVETEEDFGTQGTPPSHPELLDWLAHFFLDHDQSTKALHRLIVTSATYRQSSDYRPELEEWDPRNRFLARQSRVRFDAEIVRDAALVASGQLQRTIGGPSVQPPQPDGVYAFTQNAKRWVAAQNGDRYRRAMYTEFFRSAPYPLFTTFDAPDFQTVCTRRNRSNTPLQALTVANDEAFVELARELALRVWREAPVDPDEQTRYAFLLTLSRHPQPAEEAILQQLRQNLIAQFGETTDQQPTAWLGDRAEPFRQLFAAGQAQDADALAADVDQTLHQAAALVAICRTLLNTDNFITRE